MASHSVDIVLQPVGETPGVLKPPLAKYKPQIVVLFTSDQKYADITLEHIEFGWRKYIGRIPEIIVKVIENPWTSDTVDRYMVAFDEAVKEIESHDLVKNTPKEKVNWHVGTAGGTNLMAIASALSAFTHRFPVYYTENPDYNPKKSVEELAIEIDLFTNLGPGFKALHRTRSMKIMKIIAQHGPISPQGIRDRISTSKQNESAGRKPLADACLIINDGNGWVATNLGKSLLALLGYEEE